MQLQKTMRKLSNFGNIWKDTENNEKNKRNLKKCVDK